tara:strand:- start:6882 stop:9029 length:2148 start_codon:yes stop_codon:yes gene_type:complete
LPKPDCRHIQVTGLVQGVGFRPYVYRLAQRLGLQGEIRNRSSGVSITVQGQMAVLDQFLTELRRNAPGQRHEFSVNVAAATAHSDFVIAPSQSDAGIAGTLLADQAICEDCRREFHDQSDRRYHYPFISCTSCGPRFSICRRLPWDRINTSWSRFSLCAACRQEYESPLDRRFHAVGISCPDCGPVLFTADGLQGEAAVRQACAVLERGGVVAVKGSAGFHLLVDAQNPAAVARLRERKRRSKPLAVLAPTFEWVLENAHTEAAERAALKGSAAPIVLLKACGGIHESLAPGLGTLGVMLPSSGIQLSILRMLQRPLVATSANLSGAPLIHENDTALSALAGIADAFLLHDLDLVQGLDDAVQRVMAGQPVSLRLGRGFAPQIHTVPVAHSSLGCGAHLKVNLAMQERHTLIVGPYIGDLQGAGNRQRYLQQKSTMPAFFQIDAGTEVTDLHPDYGSSVEADDHALTVPHHVAHAMAVWLEHQPEPPFQALTWDGVGLGPDGTVWGGECLQFDAGMEWQRLGSIRPFQLPAGHDIARFPGRIARVLSGETYPGRSIACSSMGRLIEGLAALAGLREENLFEAQVAMEWEALGHRASQALHMDFSWVGADLDWRPLLPLVADRSVSLSARALGFHQALARAALRQCRLGRGDSVLLSGGVFQNRLLVELMVAGARELGLKLLLPGRLPPNDGSIAAGQCVALAMGAKQRGVAQQCA